MTRKTRVWIQLAAFAIALFSAEVAAIPRVAAHATSFIAHDPTAAVVKAGRVLARDLAAIADAGVSRLAASVGARPCASADCVRARPRKVRVVPAEFGPAPGLRSVANIMAMVLS